MPVLLSTDLEAHLDLVAMVVVGENLSGPVLKCIRRAAARLVDRSDATACVIVLMNMLEHRHPAALPALSLQGHVREGACGVIGVMHPFGVPGPILLFQKLDQATCFIIAMPDDKRIPGNPYLLL